MEPENNINAPDSEAAPAPSEQQMSQASAPAPVLHSGRAPKKVETGHWGWMLWMRDLLFAAFASVLIILFLYQPVRVEGNSMLPRLENEDRIFINKFVYHFEDIQRGDVVVFHYPRNPELSYIKRVAGVPGDRVRIDRGQVYINDNALIEPWVPAEFRDLKSSDEVTVPKDEYYVLGDHRSIASDSREFGLVKRDLIYGKASFVYWPSQDVGVVH